MAKKLDPAELVSFKEFLMANSIQIDTLCQLLIEKEVITQEEFFTKLKQVQAVSEKRTCLKRSYPHKTKVTLNETELYNRHSWFSLERQIHNQRRGRQIFFK